MLRTFVFCSVILFFQILDVSQARAQSSYVKTELPESIESCMRAGLTGLFGIDRSDQGALFDYFLTRIDIEQFGRYNYKRAWLEWGQNSEIKRLAIYEYFALMAGRRGQHQGRTTSFTARLADRPLVKGNDIHHIVARVDFAGGSSTSIVVFTSGCRAFGFMYGGANLRSFVDASTIERLFRAGKRSPF